MKQKQWKDYKDTGAEQPATGTAIPEKKAGTFETIGAFAGIGFGIYYAHYHKAAWWGYIFWVVIFTLAAHELGEQADRIMKK